MSITIEEARKLLAGPPVQRFLTYSLPDGSIGLLHADLDKEMPTLMFSLEEAEALGRMLRRAVKGVRAGNNGRRVA